MIGLFTGDMIDNSVSFYTFYTTWPSSKKGPSAGEGESEDEIKHIESLTIVWSLAVI